MMENGGWNSLNGMEMNDGYRMSLRKNTENIF